MVRIDVTKSNLKFCLEETFTFSEEKVLNYDFSQNGITCTLEFKKIQDVPWIEIFKIPLHHDCRINRIKKDGSAFVKCYYRISKINFNNKFRNVHNITKMHFENETYICDIKFCFSREIVYKRIAEHNKASYQAHQLAKLQNKNSKTLYVCNNPKSYQGGGFSPK